MMLNNSLLLANYNHSRLESDLFNYICLNVRNMDKNGFIPIRLNEVELLHQKSINNTRCYLELKRMMIDKNSFTFVEVDNTRNVPLFADILQKNDRVNNDGEVFVQVHPFIFDQLKDVSKNYTNIQTGSILRLSSPTAKRIYSLMLHYYNTGRYVAGATYYKLDLYLLREMLQLTNKYKGYGMFAQLIEKAIDEINEKTELFITKKNIKSGRLINAWNLCIKKNKRIEEEITNLYASMTSFKAIDEKVKKLKEESPESAADPTKAVYRPAFLEMETFKRKIKAVPDMNQKIADKIILKAELNGFSTISKFDWWLSKLDEILDGKGDHPNPAGYIKVSFLGKK